MASAALIGLDWGTSALRGSVLAAGGHCLERRDGGPGILAVPEGGFAAALLDFAGDWLARWPGAAVLASGMVGSRQGWEEAAYLECPVDAAEVARRLHPLRGPGGRTVHLVPGLCDRDAAGVPDVMRGEETQILGAGGAMSARQVVLPGTHSKWVRMHAGTIRGFRTHMTGEVFALLCEHSILGRTMRGQAHDPQAFRRGVRLGLSGEPGGLLSRLFSARTLGLFGELDGEQVHAYLSGVLIGSELAGAGADAGGGADPVLIVGGETLAGRYAEALAIAGIECVTAPPDSAAQGQWIIAQRAGLVPATTGEQQPGSTS